MEKPCIVVAEDLTPSDTIHMDIISPDEETRLKYQVMICEMEKDKEMLTRMAGLPTITTDGSGHCFVQVHMEKFVLCIP